MNSAKNVNRESSFSVWSTQYCSDQDILLKNPDNNFQDGHENCQLSKELNESFGLAANLFPNKPTSFSSRQDEDNSLPIPKGILRSKGKKSKTIQKKTRFSIKVDKTYNLKELRARKAAASLSTSPSVAISSTDTPSTSASSASPPLSHTQPSPTNSTSSFNSQPSKSSKKKPRKQRTTAAPVIEKNTKKTKSKRSSTKSKRQQKMMIVALDPSSIPSSDVCQVVKCLVTQVSEVEHHAMMDDVRIIVEDLVVHISLIFPFKRHLSEEIFDEDLEENAKEAAELSPHTEDHPHGSSNRRNAVAEGDYEEVENVDGALEIVENRNIADQHHHVAVEEEETVASPPKAKKLKRKQSAAGSRKSSKADNNNSNNNNNDNNFSAGASDGQAASVEVGEVICDKQQEQQQVEIIHDAAIEAADEAPICPPKAVKKSAKKQTAAIGKKRSSSSTSSSHHKNWSHKKKSKKRKAAAEEQNDEPPPYVSDCTIDNIIAALPALERILDRFSLKERVRLMSVSKSWHYNISLTLGFVETINIDELVQLSLPPKGLTFDQYVLEKELGIYEWFQKLPRPPRCVYSKHGLPIIWHDQLKETPLNLRRIVSVSEIGSKAVGIVDKSRGCPQLHLHIDKANARLTKTNKEQVDNFFANMAWLTDLKLSTNDRPVVQSSHLNFIPLANVIKQSPKALMNLNTLTISGSVKINKVLKILLKGCNKVSWLKLNLKSMEAKDLLVRKWLKSCLTEEQRDAIETLEIEDGEPVEVGRFLNYISYELSNLRSLSVHLERPNSLVNFKAVTQLQELSINMEYVDTVMDLRILSPLHRLRTLRITFKFRFNNCLFICDLPLTELELRCQSTAAKHTLNLSRLSHPFTSTVRTLTISGVTPSNYGKLGQLRRSSQLRTLNYLFSNNYNVNVWSEQAVGPELTTLGLMLPDFDVDFGGCMNMMAGIQKLIKKRLTDGRLNVGPKYVETLKQVDLHVRKSSHVDACRRQVKDLQNVCQKMKLGFKIILKEW